MAYVALSRVRTIEGLCTLCQTHLLWVLHRAKYTLACTLDDSSVNTILIQSCPLIHNRPNPFSCQHLSLVHYTAVACPNFVYLAKISFLLDKLSLVKFVQVLNNLFSHPRYEDQVLVEESVP